jgi:hypothetical protein
VHTPSDVGGRAADRPPLENKANKSAHPLPAAAEKRLTRWDARADLWELSSLQRVRHCGRVARSNVDAIALRAGAYGPSWAGLQHCGSVHAEPVCAATIRAHRALEVGGVLGAALADHQTLTFGTFTGRHRLGQPLTLLWDAAKTAWHDAVTNGGSRKQMQRAGVVGWVRVWDATFGANGWHLHPHWVMAGDGDAAAMEAVCEGMWERWERSMVRQGLARPLRRGQEWHRVEGAAAAGELGEYLFKLAEGPQAPSARQVGSVLGVELAHTMPGRTATVEGTRPVWSLLDAARLDGDAEALAYWHEWENGSKGRRQIGWGGKLRQQYEPDDDELSDDEIANLERGTSVDDVLRLSVAAWGLLVGVRRGPALVIEGWYRGGLLGARQVLEELGVPYALADGEA